MKKRLLPAISIGIAVVIIGSIAYAADRKKNAKTIDRPADNIHDQEALRAELLEALEHRDKKPQDPGDTRKVAAIRPDDNNTAVPAKMK